MEIGDRVRHKKYGLGTVKSLYPKHDAARVVYDSGHETTNAQKRLEVVPSTWGAGPTAPAVPTQPGSAGTRRGGGAGSSVDYRLLDRAREHVSSLNPEADHVVPRIYGSRVYCEVWQDKSARIVFYEEAA